MVLTLRHLGTAMVLLTALALGGRTVAVADHKPGSYVGTLERTIGNIEFTVIRDGVRELRTTPVPYGCEDGVGGHRTTPGDDA